MSTMFIQNDPGPALTDITVLRRLDMTSETGWGEGGGGGGGALLDRMSGLLMKGIYLCIYLCLCVCVCV